MDKKTSWTIRPNTRQEELVRKAVELEGKSVTAFLLACAMEYIREKYPDLFRS